MKERIAKQEEYQAIYSQDPKYGDPKSDGCPGTRFFPLYKDHLRSSVMDFGCGRGETVKLMREKGFEAEGVDWVELDNGMIVGDITKEIILPEDCRTTICMDVLEHIPDEQLPAVLANMAKADRQVMSISNDPGRVFDGARLHCTLKPANKWSLLFKKYFTISDIISLDNRRTRYLYLTYTK